MGPVAAVAGGLWYWFGQPGVVATDKAYIKQDIVSIAGEVTGLITAVNVRDSQHVKAGDVLFTIDDFGFTTFSNLGSCRSFGVETTNTSTARTNGFGQCSLW